MKCPFESRFEEAAQLFEIVFKADEIRSAR